MIRNIMRKLLFVVGLLCVCLLADAQQKTTVVLHRKATMNELGLNEQQQAEITALTQQSTADIKKIRENPKLAESKKKSEISQIYVKRQKAYEAVLTSEQLAKYQQLKNVNKGESVLYKSLPLRKIERTTSADGLTIVVPKDKEWHKLGTAIASALKRYWKKDVKVHEPDETKFATGWSGNVIVLGNLANNKQMARLYGMRYAYADAVYPGKAGYQLQTVIDPFGHGGNTIVIGASDLEGAKLGVQKLLEVLQQQKDPSIPWLMERRLAEATTQYFRDYERSFKPKSNPAFFAGAKKLLNDLRPVMYDEPSKNVLLRVRAQINLFGEYYVLTGAPGYRDVYRELLLGYARFLNRYPKEANNQLVWKNMWSAGEKFFQLYAMLEGAAIFSDEERKEIVSALYLTCEANAQDPYLKGAKEKASRWNHEIFPAMSLVGSSFYFETYYDLPEIAEWRHKGHRIFVGNTTALTLDEGSDYLVHVPMVTIDYAMFTGQESFLQKTLRISADLQAMMIDNLGTMAGGGDTYPFGRSSAYSWGHSQVMYAASWYYNDPKYNYLLENAYRGPFPKQAMSDLQYPIRRYMATHSQADQMDASRYAKVEALEVEQGVYDDLKKTQELNVEQHTTFHKMTFRAGFGLDDSYLVIDGFSAGKHGHDDGNAILDYSAYRRLFLVDRDYIQKSPENHTGVVVVKNGEQHPKPALAQLQWVGDMDGVAISKSSVPDYNGTDWDRTIVSPDGQFFIIYDDLTFRESGHYLLRNLWQSLGTATTKGNTFHVEQKGVTMLIQNLGQGIHRLKNIYGHFIKYWKLVYDYPHADSETVLSQDILEREYQKGERTGFVNVLSSHREDTAPVESYALDARSVVVRSQGKSWVAIRDGLEGPGIFSNGNLHLIGEKEFIAVAVSKLRIGSKELNFEKPVFFKLNATNGEWKAYSVLKNKTRYDATGNPVEAKPLQSGQLSWNLSDQRQLTKSFLDRGTLPVNEIVSARSAVGVKNSQKFRGLHEQVTSSCTGDLDGDGVEESVLLAGINGNVAAIDAKGKTWWTFKAKGRVNEITFQRVGNRSFIFIATENWYLHALDIEGNELWQHQFPSGGAETEYKGNLLGLTHVRIAYLQGKDADPSVMVGTQFRFVYELDLAGKRKGRSLLYYYGIEDMAFADFDGDGKDEGVIAMEYYNFVVLKGKKETRFGRLRGPGWKFTKLVDSYGDKGLPGVLLGTKQREVMLVQYEGKVLERWVKNVGGEVNVLKRDLSVGKNGSEILVGTEGFQFYVLSPDGETIFRKTLDNRVLSLNSFVRDKQTGYLAGTAGGRLCELTDSHQKERWVQFDAEIADIHVIRNGTLPVVVLESGEVIIDF